MPDAVVFDLDGVIVDSESAWVEAKRELVDRAGGTWKPEATRAMLGMSSPEWSRYLRDELGVPMPVEEINAAVVAALERHYREALPCSPARSMPCGSSPPAGRSGLRRPPTARSSTWSSSRPGLNEVFAVTVSSEEVARGKPAPDVYFEAARGSTSSPGAASRSRTRATGCARPRAAGMGVVAIPNREFPPDPDALALADAVLGSIEELTPDVVSRLG
jgi:beta-phosphoglucomutase-like phosphatase (HAD superfamily)